MKSFAITLAPPLEKISEPVSFPLALAFNENVINSGKYKKNGVFGVKGYGIPAELFPENLDR